MISSGEIFKRHLHQVQQLIRKSALHGESNSLLIVGPRGAGKSSLLNHALSSLMKEKEINKKLLVVNLNSLIHTEESIALKDIARQLKLSNLIPDEDQVTGSFADNMNLLLETLRTENENGKTILFCLEEFDLFCQHRNQNLLYNLFDAAQAQHTPIAVIGITCRLDVIELLEKRVKSRFSHRQLHLFHDVTFDMYAETARYWLSLKDNFPNKNLTKEWNSLVAMQLNGKLVKNQLRQIYELTLDFRALQRFLWPVVGRIRADKSPADALKDSHFVESFEISMADSKAAMLKGLSILELTLMIIMVQISKINDGEPFNFHMVYEQYSKMCRNETMTGMIVSGVGIQEFGKEVVSKSFEHLQQLELVQPTSTFYNKGQKEYRSLRVLVEARQLGDVISKYPALPTQLHQVAMSVIYGT